MEDFRDEMPICPHCGKPMRLARTVPGIGGLPELRTYACRECGASVTQAEEPGERAAALNLR